MHCISISEIKNGKSAPNKIPSSSESISVSDVLYQLSSLRKVSNNNIENI